MQHHYSLEGGLSSYPQEIFQSSLMSQIKFDVLTSSCEVGKAGVFLDYRIYLGTPDTFALANEVLVFVYRIHLVICVYKPHVVTMHLFLVHSPLFKI
uniref:Uncharacterized protein n=1 Tax=Megaselia scalaris TaxID=36166 RepID=T1GEN5_MEGSC